MIKGLNVNSCSGCICMSSSFKNLKDDELKFISKNRAEVKYKKGEMMCKQGTFATHVIYIKKGLVKIYMEQALKNMVIAVEGSGTFLNLQYLFTDDLLDYSVACYEDTEVCMFEIDKFKQLCLSNPIFASSIIKIQSEYTIKGYNRLTCLTQRQMHGRFAHIILCLYKNIYKTENFTVSLSRKDLAEITEMSIESLSRVIKEFQKDKILNVDGKQFTILNIEKLEQLRDFG